MKRSIFVFKLTVKLSIIAQCVKSRALTKFIDSILEVESFQHKCVIIKGSL